MRLQGRPMGACTSKPSKPNPFSTRAPQPLQPLDTTISITCEAPVATDAAVEKKSIFFSFYTPSPARYFFSKKSPALPPPSAPPSANSTPRETFKRPFPPPSPTKVIKAVLLRWHGRNHNTATIPEGEEGDAATPEELDKRFGLSKQFTSKYEVEDEVGRGHFGYTCSAVAKKGDLKGQKVAVKVIPKQKVPYSTHTHTCMICPLFYCNFLLCFVMGL